jgi:hypothetical protein
MNVSATDSNGNKVNFVNVIPNGCQVYTVYVDSSSNLKVDRIFLSGNGDIIGTGASIIS